jgi:pimeloyl-ACP methyl ester carboxylesterase
MTDFVLATDGTRIAYELIGSGRPALVLVHGWSCDRTYWNAQLEALSRNFTIVTVDLAGHGESECCRETWSIAAFGSDVALIVTLNSLEDVVLVGHSMGGDVILEAARRLSTRVRGLIWIDTYRALPETSSSEDVQRRMGPFRANFAEETSRFVRTMFGVDADPSLVERIARDMSAAPVDVALEVMEAAWTFGPAVPALLSELRLPLIAINPDNSSTDVDSLHSRGIDVQLMPGVGHFPMLENPHAFNLQLVSAIKALAKRGGRSA